MDKFGVVGDSYEFSVRNVLFPSLVDSVVILLIDLVRIGNLHLLKAVAPILQSWQLLVSSLIMVAFHLINRFRFLLRSVLTRVVCSAYRPQ